MAQRRPMPPGAADQAPQPSARPAEAPHADSGDGSFGTVDVDQALDDALQRPLRRAWRPWQRRAMAAALLLGCLGIGVLVRTLMAVPYVDAAWRATAQGAVQLASSPLPQLQALKGATLQTINGGRGQSLAVNDLSLLRSPRWSVDAPERQRAVESQVRLAEMWRSSAVRLQFDEGREAIVEPGPRGIAGLGALFWLTCAAALALYMVGVLVLVAQPRPRNLVYLVMCFSQAANLLAIGIECMPGLGWPIGFARHAPLARIAFDLATAAAAVHFVALQPLRLPRASAIAAVVWLAVAVLLVALVTGALTAVWWWTQFAVLSFGSMVIALLAWSYRIEPNPLAVLMRHFAAMAVATLALLSLAAVVASRQVGALSVVASVGSVIWYLFMASVLIQLPFISRTQRLMREFAMLAGISTVATSLGMLFESLFGFQPLAALSLSVFIALGVYIAIRQWLFRQVSGGSMLSAERLFERLYRMVRDVEARPQDSAELLEHLLRELFQPMEVRRLTRLSARTRVFGDGSIMLVPLPRIDEGQPAQPNASILMRFAGRGTRIFTRDDARLTDRVVEQLRRAVAYDKAVERGRSEERTRIAQDLHDDIGARLLTLMYKSQTPEIEDYIRHTLKDLKTLTRGLAATDQRLSHATAEWKSDIGQRLTAAQIELSWSFSYDRDIVLSVVQWSALTRVLRELVSNAIQHSCATHVDIAASLERGRLRLSFGDDGIGRTPQAWSHGLGLGGVRKRVKLLGGSVQWRENGRAGIVCVVLLPDVDARQ
jgi:signal transduction histidine kinase